MQLRDFLGFHSGINNLTIFLLYEAMLLGKWLQTFRQTVKVLFWKEERSKTSLPVEDWALGVETHYLKVAFEGKPGTRTVGIAVSCLGCWAP